jgi:hypothetical protein
LPAVVGAAGVIGMMGYEKRFSFDQVAINKQIIQYYSGENTEKALSSIQKRFFRGRKVYRSNKNTYRATKKEIARYLDENKDNDTLCANEGTEDDILKITEEVISYLANLNLIPMDLVWSDEVSEELKEYVSNNYLYFGTENLGKSITSKQFKSAVLNNK